jgi:hypothetical protein
VRRTNAPWRYSEKCPLWLIESTLPTPVAMAFACTAAGTSHSMSAMSATSASAEKQDVVRAGGGRERTR